MSLFCRKDPDQQLLDAASDVDIPGVREALRRRADPNAREDREGQTALHLCIRGRKSPPHRVGLGTVRFYRPFEDIQTIVDFLLDAGADVNRRGRERC